MDNNNKNLKKERVHGFWVEFDEKAEPTVHYLQGHLDFNEVRTYFDEARKRGFADFEDRQGINWRLTCNRQSGTFTLVHR